MTLVTLCPSPFSVHIILTMHSKIKSAWIVITILHHSKPMLFTNTATELRVTPSHHQMLPISTPTIITWQSPQSFQHWLLTLNITWCYIPTLRYLQPWNTILKKYRFSFNTSYYFSLARISSTTCEYKYRKIPINSTSAGMDNYHLLPLLVLL